MIIFDLDGTLIRWWPEEVDCPQCDGIGCFDDAPCLVCDDNGKKTFHDRDRYGWVEPLPDRQYVLDRLIAQGHKIGIATNQTDIGFGRITMAKLTAKVEAVEAEFGHTFEWSIAMGSPGAPWPWNDSALVAQRKPAPTVIDALREEFPITVFVGDSMKDCEAAARGWVPFASSDWFFDTGWKHFVS